MWGTAGGAGKHTTWFECHGPFHSIATENEAPGGKRSRFC